MSVQNYYDNNFILEWQRLDSALGRVEFASTFKLIEGYFPPRGNLCDIGGGPGRYAIELMKRGYDLTLVDISEACLKFAADEFENSGFEAKRIAVGDARDLSMFAGDSFDGALLLGPMIHIINSEERKVALGELLRVLKVDGTAIISYLNAWGLMRIGLVDFPR